MYTPQLELAEEISVKINSTALKEALKHIKMPIEPVSGRIDLKSFINTEGSIPSITREIKVSISSDADSPVILELEAAIFECVDKVEHRNIQELFRLKDNPNARIVGKKLYLFPKDNSCSIELAEGIKPPCFLSFTVLLKGKLTSDEGTREYEFIYDPFIKVTSGT